MMSVRAALAERGYGRGVHPVFPAPWHADRLTPNLNATPAR